MSKSKAEKKVEATIHNAQQEIIEELATGRIRKSRTDFIKDAIKRLQKDIEEGEVPEHVESFREMVVVMSEFLNQLVGQQEVDEKG
jgi:Arc/MetJ-type ribon-helix-helix transcriptional regulator